MDLFEERKKKRNRLKYLKYEIVKVEKELKDLEVAINAKDQLSLLDDIDERGLKHVDK